MKKRFIIYVLAWVLLLGAFNAIAFLSPGWVNYDKYTASFWIGYSFISIAFVGQLICAAVTFSAKTAQKTFYRIPLVKKSYAGLIASFIFGGLCMFISPLPAWIGAIICAVILFFNVKAILKMGVAVNEVERIDEKVQKKTVFIKSMTIDADTLMAQAKSDALKAECKKVYEAFRYSDPMSDDKLGSIEDEILAKFSEFSDAVKSEADNVADIAQNVVALIENRNKKCKLLK